MLEDVVIVVVDDHYDIRFFLAEFLTRRGATVFPCSDAIEGLAAVRTHRPDIVLSDISLPGRDGFELLQDIRSLGPEQGGAVPAVAMTALGDVLDRKRTTNAGFAARLDKPFRPEQLLGAIRFALPNRVKLGRE